MSNNMSNNMSSITNGYKGTKSLTRALQDPNTPPAVTRVLLRIQSRKLTYRELSEAIGSKPAHVSLILSGQRTPSILLARRLADVLRLTLDDVYEFIRAKRGELTPRTASARANANANTNTGTPTSPKPAPSPVLC